MNIKDQQGYIDQLEERLEQTQALNKAILAIDTLCQNTEFSILDFLLENAISLTKSELGYLYFYNEETQMLTNYAWSKGLLPDDHECMRQPECTLESTGQLGEAIYRRRVIIDNHYADQQFEAIRRHLCTPVFINHKIVAAAGVANKSVDYDDRDADMLQILMNHGYVKIVALKMTAAFNKSESMYRSTFEQTTTGICHVNLDGCIIEANQAFSKMVGYEPAEIAHLKVTKLVSLRKSEKYCEPIENMVKGDLPDFSMELPFIKKNKEQIWVHVNASMMKDANGNPNYVIMMVNDIDEKVRFERELQLKNLELHMVEEIGKAITKSLDFDGLLGTINKTLKSQLKFDALMLFEYKENQDKLTLKAYTGIPDLEANGFKALSFENSIAGSAIASGAIKQGSLKNYPNVDLDQYFKSKGYKYTVSMPIFTPTQSVWALSMLFKKEPKENFGTDRLLKAISAQLAIGIHNANLYQDLKIAKQSAEDANRVKGEFLATISHEIRTPLHAVIGFSELLKRNHLKSDNADHINGIQVAARSLLTLINKILDLSKIEAGMMVVKEERISLDMIFKEIEHIFAQSAFKKALTLQFEIDPQLPKFLWLDNARLTQVLLNLVGNAIKFTEKGGVHITARVGISETQGDSKNAETEGGPLQGQIQGQIQGETQGQIQGQEGPQLQTMALELMVSDTGIGIQPKYIDSIFDAFQQQMHEDSKEYGGTGLGLAISKKLIEVMGGSISVASELEGGTTFKINLSNVHYIPDALVVPRVHLKQPPQVELKKVLQGEQGTDVKKMVPYSALRKHVSEDHIIFTQATVLVVDDDTLNLRLMKVLLEPLGITVQLATDGHMAIRLASQFIPDLIFMDLRMPTMDGKSAALQIKKNPNTKHIPIVALTAHQIFSTQNGAAKSMFQANQRVYLEHFFDDYLLKPVEIRRVRQMLTRYIGHKQIKPKIANQAIESLDQEQRIRLIELLEPSVSKLKVVLNSQHLNRLIANLKQLNSQFKLATFAEVINRLERYRSGWDIESIKREIDTLSEQITYLQELYDDTLINLPGSEPSKDVIQE